MSSRTATRSLVGVAIVLAFLAAVFLLSRDHDEASDTSRFRTGETDRSAGPAGRRAAWLGPADHHLEDGPTGAAQATVSDGAAGTAVAGAGTGAVAGLEADPDDQMPETGFALGPVEDEPGGSGQEDPAKKTIHCSIEGTVRVDGKPQANAAVHLFPMRGGGRFVPGESGPIGTDVDGRFRIADIVGNKYRLTATVAGASAKGAWIDCQNDGEVIEAVLDLEPAAIHVSGLVTDLQGSPLAQSSIVARRLTLNMKSFHQARAVPVGADGGFDFWLPDPKFEIVGGAVGYHGHVLGIPKERQEVELIFRLEPLSLLNGIVIGPEGPQADVMVAASTKNQDGSSVMNSVTSGPDGRFTVECGPGEADVTAWDKKSWAHRVVPPRQEGTDAQDVTLELRPGRTLTGRVHLEDGSPAPMAEVGCHSLPTGVGGVVQTNMQGIFEVGGLPPGEPAMVFCLRDKRPFQERMLTVPADQPQVDVLFVPSEE